MKKVIVYIFIITVISCAKPRNDKDLMEKEVSTEAVSNDTKEMFHYQNISQQKLQDLFDLLVLQKKHPEFKDDITNQLNELSKDSISISDKINTISIENISVRESIQQLSDSVQTMKINFDKVSNIGVSKDSLMVVIKTKKITIDEQELESTNVMFKKLE